MPLPRVYKVVQDSLGNVVPLVSCSVLLEGTGTLATLWQDDAATIPLSNPMVSDATYGSFAFYVTPAHYDLTFTKPGYTFQSILDLQVPQDDLTLGTMAQQDANAVAITGGDVTGLTTLHANRLGVGVGTAGFTVQYLRFPGTEVGIALQSYTAGTVTAIQFRNPGGTQVGSITTTDTATSYATSSDARLKTAVQPLTGALDVIRALKPITHLWRADDSRGVGFLAGEVQQVVDGVITGEPDAIDEEGRIVPQMIDLSKLVPWLTAALKDTLAVIDTLTARVAALEGAIL